MPSIKDVAEYAGVSVATVSRVLNHHPRVKPHLRERVLEAIQKLEYQPSSIARDMRSQSQKGIGLLISDIQNSFFADLVKAIGQITYEKGYRLYLYDTDGKLEKEEAYIGLLMKERASGVIMIPTGWDCQKILNKLNVPVVMVDRKLSTMKYDFVALDNVKATYLATAHLVSLGHRRIGLVTSLMGGEVSAERRRGYEKALEESGLPVIEQYIRWESKGKTHGYSPTISMLEQNPRPTAILTTNNQTTFGALKAIKELDMKIPEDISLLAFDDMPWLELLSPQISAIYQPTYEIGKTAAELLFKRMEDRSRESFEPEKILLNPRLILRKSIRKINPDAY